MSECKLDHSLEDVIHKLESQRPFLPEHLLPNIDRYLKEHSHTQAKLNEFFHLLKKYDLASKEEQEKRNEHLMTIINI